MMLNSLPPEQDESIKPAWCRDTYAGPARTITALRAEHRVHLRAAIARVQKMPENKDSLRICTVVGRKRGNVMFFDAAKDLAESIGISLYLVIRSLRRGKFEHDGWTWTWRKS